MKTLVVLLAAFIACVSAAESSNNGAIMPRGISDKIVSAIEKFRDQMHCGFPEQGIPPLAPYENNHRAVEYNSTLLDVNGEVNQFRIDGMDNFEIKDMRVIIVKSRVKFFLLWNNITTNTDYILNSIVKKGGLTVNLAGDGKARITLTDLEIRGNVKYSLGFSGKIKLKELKITVKLNGLDSDISGIFGSGKINEKFNEMLAEFIMIAINDNQEAITEKIEKTCLPIINEILGKKLMHQMMMIGDEEAPCNPPSKH